MLDSDKIHAIMEGIVANSATDLLTQDETDIDPYSLARLCGKREPQLERLGELLSLPKLKSVDEQG